MKGEIVLFSVLGLMESSTIGNCVRVYADKEEAVSSTNNPWALRARSTSTCSTIS